MHVVVTGGLTGGHVLPGVSVALALTARGHRVTYLGAQDQLEQRVCQDYGVPFVGLPFRRHGRLRRAHARTVGVVAATRALRALAPAVVFSKGSDVSIPIVLAASRLHVPVVAHESDRVPGSETLFLAARCAMVCLGDGAAGRHFDRPTTVTGNITRPNFGAGSPAEFGRLFGPPAGKPVVFVTGGSQGSVSVNELVYPILPVLTERYSVVHQCGPGKLVPQRASDYRQIEFIGDEIKHVYAASSVVVARAGATSIAEICQYRVPAILIPLPWAEGDHQQQNALVLRDHGVGRILHQRDATPAGLLALVDEMVADRAR
ncbi:MAG: glycosyltransferase, partial [Sporichthyaceae bacterium]|nr:glycosyltransferase [Sporichthyaceae bacterium]